MFDFFFQAEDGIRDGTVTGVQTCALPIFAAHANGGHEIDLSWVGSTSPIGVAGYDISRDGTKVATVSGATLSYADKGLTDATTYSYTVDSFDAVGNTSNQSAPASATTADVTAP